MKKKKSVRVRAERGYGPRHMMNAQEGSDAVPSDLPSPPEWVEEARRRVAAGQGMKNLTPGILGGVGEAGSQLAGMSKEDVAKLAISMLAGGEGEMTVPGAMPAKVWHSMEPVGGKSFDGGGAAIRKDAAGNHYEQIGTHYDKDTGAWHAIVKPVESPGAPVTKTDWTADEHGNPLYPKEPPQKPYDFNKWQEQVGKGQGQYEEPPLVEPMTPEEKADMDAHYGDLPGSILHKLGITGEGLDNPVPPTHEELNKAFGVNMPEGMSMEELLDWYAKGLGLKPKDPPPESPPEELDKQYGPSPTGKSWGNANDRKYSGPLVGQQWADIYATPDTEFTVGEAPTQAEIDAEIAKGDTPPPPKKAQDALDKLKDYFTKNPPPEGPQPPTDRVSGAGPLPPELSGDTPEQRVDANYNTASGNFLDLLSPEAKAKSEQWKKYGRWVDLPPEGLKRGKVAVAKGFGPTHAENSKEGEDLTKVNTDTVPAMLTPREAVLNRNAAELAGRGTIEKLNSEGNKLARNGVDLAARGDGDVANYNGKQLWDAIMTALQGRQAPADKLGPVPVPGAMAQKGTSDMKSKVKQSKPQSGSPYVQAFQNLMPRGGAPVGYQGGGGNVGGTDPMMPGMGGGLGARDQYGRQFSNRDASGSYGQGNGVPGAGVPGGPYGTRNDTGPGVIGGPMGGGPFPGRGPGGVYPGAGGMPGAFGSGSAPNGMPYQSDVGTGANPSGPFPGRAPNGMYYQQQGLADGSSNVGPIGTPPQGEQAYGPPVNLTAPQIQQLAKQTGISPGQIMGLMKAFQGGKDIYNSVGTGGYDTASPATSQAVGDAFGFGAQGMQGGISDIGYPPFVAPSASYDGNRGGWLGPYDPSFMIQRYAGGTSYVSPFR